MIQYIDLVDDTICAPITATGYSGVAVIRISGGQSLYYTKQLCSFLPEKIESHKVYLGHLKSKEDQLKIDHVLITYFKEGSSFTGDEVVEVSCHGSPLIVNQIVNQYLDLGCRNAERGEFSFRAFYNGKIDLVQAESIQKIITSNTSGGSKESLKQLDGDLSNIFVKLEDDMVLSISHLEATIDFVEEDIDPKEVAAVKGLLNKIQETTKSLLSSYDVGKSLLNGYKVLLVGETNVGKSSLFNELFNQEKAIVTDINGTTRDLITGETFLGTVAVEFTDSAGVRESDDLVESIGIKKTLSKVDESDLLFCVIDSSKFSINQDLLSAIESNKSFFIFNKMDLVNDRKEFIDKAKAQLKEVGLVSTEKNTFFISASKKEGIDFLKEGLLEHIQSKMSTNDQPVITQARHYNHLTQINDKLSCALSLIDQEESPDIISQELQTGLMEVQKLMGKTYDDQILDKIFSEFCIGK